jgi:hypothetical protein
MALTRNTKFVWNKQQQDAFKKLKMLITSAPVLQMPTNDKPYCLETDASEYAIGAILSQEFEDKWYPLSYFS